MATILNVPVIGVERVGGYDIRVQRRPGATTVWLTMLGRVEMEDVNLGTVSGLHTDDPQIWIFQRCKGWATPSVRALLVSAVTQLYWQSEACADEGP